MNKEVKRYNTTLLGTDMPPCAVSASDYDALRAENERLEVRAAQAYMKGHGDASNVMLELEAERDQLRAELEALLSRDGNGGES